MSYPLDRVHMISFRRYGYRMIGAADRAALLRARYLGDAGPLTFTSANYRAGSSQMTGESTTYTAPPPPPPPPPAPPAPVHKVLAFHLGPPPASVLPAPVRTSLVTSAPVVVDTLPVLPPADLGPPPAASPGMAETPDCSCGTKMALGAAGGALLMYFVGLATREMKKKRRR